MPVLSPDKLYYYMVLVVTNIITSISFVCVALNLRCCVCFCDLMFLCCEFVINLRAHGVCLLNLFFNFEAALKADYVNICN